MTDLERRRKEIVARLRDETYKAMTKPLYHNTPALDAAVRDYLAVPDAAIGAESEQATEDRKC